MELEWIPSDKKKLNTSKMWKDVVSLKEVEGLLSYMGTEGCQWLLGKGKKIMSWLDDWLPDKPLKVFFPTTLFPGM